MKILTFSYDELRFANPCLSFLGDGKALLEHFVLLRFSFVVFLFFSISPVQYVSDWLTLSSVTPGSTSVVHGRLCAINISDALLGGRPAQLSHRSISYIYERTQQGNLLHFLVLNLEVSWSIAQGK